MRRSEYNPFLHNAWMLMGRSQYHNGDFTGAAATFYYISKNFKWLPEVVTEAKLWQARAYLADDWTYEADMIVSRIKPDQLVTKTLRRLYAFDYADLYIRTDRYAEAVPHLQTLISLSDAHQRMRLNYLLGQILTRLGRKEEAYKAFGRAGGSAQADYAMQFNARIRQSEVYQGDDIAPEVKALRRMVRYDRNAEYLDQIYYAIGNLYLSRRDTTEAIDNYRQAVSKSTRSGYDKALANLALGNLYFDQHRYDLAQPCIAEAGRSSPTTSPGLTRYACAAMCLTSCRPMPRTCIFRTRCWLLLPSRLRSRWRCASAWHASMSTARRRSRSAYASRRRGRSRKRINP